MNNSIDSQAKNEIGELLKELVVAPVSDGFRGQLIEATASLAKLEEKLNELKTISGKIENIKDSLSKKLYPNIDDIISSIGSIEEKNKDIKTKTGKIDDIQSKVNEAIKEFNITKEPIQNIEKILNENKRDIQSCLILCQAISDRIGNFEMKISYQLHHITQNIDNSFHSVNDSIRGISTSLENKRLNASEEHKLQYKQNKNSFLILIVLSIINMLGLIGLLMIHFIH